LGLKSRKPVPPVAGGRRGSVGGETVGLVALLIVSKVLMSSGEIASGKLLIAAEWLINLERKLERGVWGSGMAGKEDAGEEIFSRLKESTVDGFKELGCKSGAGGCHPVVIV